ncbi:Histone-Lysine N-Methyltransferase ash1l [Entophlyctis luteolus]|nr:Histone-Lysine N-Methyltransferase ash1l [Entophlyctis luteolus]
MSVLPTLNLSLVATPLPHPLPPPQQQHQQSSLTARSAGIRLKVRAFFRACVNHPPRPCLLVSDSSDGDRNCTSLSAFCLASAGMAMPVALARSLVLPGPLHDTICTDIVNCISDPRAREALTTAFSSTEIAVDSAVAAPADSRPLKRRRTSDTSHGPSPELDIQYKRQFFINELLLPNSAYSTPLLASLAFVDEIEADWTGMSDSGSSVSPSSASLASTDDTTWARAMNSILHSKSPATGATLLNLLTTVKESFPHDSTANKAVGEAWKSLEKYIHPLPRQSSASASAKKIAPVVPKKPIQTRRITSISLQNTPVKAKTPRKAPAERLLVASADRFSSRKRRDASNEKEIVASSFPCEVPSAKLPGDITREAEEKWDGRYKGMMELYSRKDFLTAGLYSGFLNTESPVNKILVESEPSVSAPSKRFTFSLPIYFGDTMLNTIEDFSLTHDLFRFIECVGAGELLIVPDPATTNFVDRQTKATSVCANTKKWADCFSCSTKFAVLKFRLVDIFVDRRPRKGGIHPVCNCVAPPNGGIACGSDCLNRLMQFECVEGKCPTGSACSNQRFQRGESAPDLELCETVGRGFGIRATARIPKNSLVMEYCGEIISQETCLERMETMYASSAHYYFLTYDRTEVIDGGRKGSLARFVNHSCDPNCRIEKWGVEGEFCVGIFADRDIEAGTELTYDYKFESFGPMKKCLCGGRRCRGFLGLNKNNNDLRSDIKVLKLGILPINMHLADTIDPATYDTLDPELLSNSSDTADIHRTFAFKRILLPTTDTSSAIPFTIRVLDGTPFDSGINIAVFGGIMPSETMLALLREAAEVTIDSRVFIKRNIRRLARAVMGVGTALPSTNIISPPVFLKRCLAKRLTALPRWRSRTKRSSGTKYHTAALTRHGRSRGAVARWTRRSQKLAGDSVVTDEAGNVVQESAWTAILTRIERIRADRSSAGNMQLPTEPAAVLPNPQTKTIRGRRCDINEIFTMLCARRDNHELFSGAPDSDGGACDSGVMDVDDGGGSTCERCEVPEPADFQTSGRNDKCRLDSADSACNASVSVAVTGAKRRESGRLALTAATEAALRRQQEGKENA